MLRTVKPLLLVATLLAAAWSPLWASPSDSGARNHVATDSASPGGTGFTVDGSGALVIDGTMVAQGIVTGLISGVVTNAVTTLPVANVDVAFYASTGSRAGGATTNAQGFYTSTGLPIGSYFVLARGAWPYDVIDELFNNISCWFGDCTVTTGTPVIVAAAATTNVNFELMPGGRISGTVTDAATTFPIAYTNVWFYTGTGYMLGFVRTDTQGAYTSFALETGSYFVRTQAPSSLLLDELFDNIPCLSCPALGCTASCTVTSGTPVTVTVPATTVNINFALSLTATYPPVNLSHPLSVTVLAGSQCSFFAGAVGALPMTTQWQVSADGGGTWTNVDGAASSTLAFTATIADDGKQFRALFTNSVGSATSNAATLTVMSQVLTFSDDPLIAGATSIKAAQVTKLRQAVNALRARYGLWQYAWTEATLTPRVTPVKAVHLTELRTALAAAYVAAGRTPPTYSTATITPRLTVITATQIAELRAAVLALW